VFFSTHKFQMYDYDMYDSSSDALRHIYGHSPTYSKVQPYNLCTTSALSRAFPLQRRRYSIGGLPSSSIADYCNLAENASILHNQSTNITNLLCEATKSLSRSSNILNQRFSHGGLPTRPGSDPNLMPMPITNFNSYQNVMSHRLPTSFSSSNYDLSNYLPSYFKPSSDYLLSKPIYSNNLYSSHTANLSCQSPLGLLSPTKKLPLQNYSSNPVLSHTVSSYLPYHSSTNHPFCSDSTSAYYSNQPMYHQIYPSSNIHLDYNRPNEMKRQVSFKFDVDTLSAES
jgi:hypothetical protein